MENENKCPVAEMEVKGEVEGSETEYTLTPDGTVVEASAVKENPQVFAEALK